MGNMFLEEGKALFNEWLLFFVWSLTLCVFLICVCMCDYWRHIVC